MHVLELNYAKILEICEEIEEEEQLEVFGPQIELNLGNPTDMGEPPVEITGVAPTVVVEVEEKSSVKVVEAKASVEREMGDQAVRTGDKPVHEIMEERTGAEPVLVDEEMETGAEPVLMDVEAVRTWEEPVPADMEMGTGDMPVHEKEGVILPLRIRVMSLKRWGSTLLKKPHNHRQSLLLKTLLKKHPPVLNQGGRRSRLRRGERTYHGPEAHRSQVQNLSILLANLSKTAFPTNQKII